MDMKIKESELFNMCTNITIEKIDRFILQANKKEFRRKHRVNNLMVGRVEKIRRETIQIWKKFLTENRLVESVSQDAVTQVENPSMHDVNKVEDTQDVAGQQILDSIEVEADKEHDKLA